MAEREGSMSTRYYFMAYRSHNACTSIHIYQLEISRHIPPALRKIYQNHASLDRTTRLPYHASPSWEVCTRRCIKSYRRPHPATPPKESWEGSIELDQRCHVVSSSTPPNDELRGQDRVPPVRGRQPCDRVLLVEGISSVLESRSRRVQGIA